MSVGGLVRNARCQAEVQNRVLVARGALELTAKDMQRLVSLTRSQLMDS